METNKMTLEERQEYIAYIQMLAKGNVDRIYMNSGDEHALIVLIELFKKAANSIRIFAGSLCGSLGDDIQYIYAISNFIDKGGNVKILVTEYNEDKAYNSPLYRQLAFFKDLGKSVEIKHTDFRIRSNNSEDTTDKHFTVADSQSYRIETNIEDRTARGNFNDSETAQKLEDMFDEMFSSNKSRQIDLSQLLIVR